MRALAGKRLLKGAWLGFLLVLIPLAAGLGIETASGQRGFDPKERNEYAIRHPDVYVPSTPANTVRGGFPINLPPVQIVYSGQVVRIDTLTGSGATSADFTPEEFFAPFGVKPWEILPDVYEFWKTVAPRGTRVNYGGGHILTGPVYISNAEPGDVLEVQILDLEIRVPYGINSTSPTGGALGTGYPGFRTGDLGLDIPPVPAGAPGGVYPDVRQHLYRIAKVKGQEVALFSKDIHVPLQPFMGVMATASPEGVFVTTTPTGAAPALGVQSSGPPGPFGGNMDNKLLTKGATLYLPVFQSGARFYVGDPHSVQGDGEVSGTAIEHSLTGTFRFILHKGKSLKGPWAEDDDYYIMMGIDHDLDRAMRFAVLEVVRFLVEEKGLTQAKAFSLASIGVDFAISEVVDGTQVVSGKIPKSLFIKDKR